MKHHRISDYILDKERRHREQIKGLVGHDNYWKEIRSTPPDYSKPKRIILVPIESEPPEWVQGIKINSCGELFGYESETCCDVEFSRHELLGSKSPFSHNDTLVLMEEWHIDPHSVQQEELKIGTITIPKGFTCLERLYLRSEYEHRFPHAGWIWQPSSTMPKELDSRCKQYTVKSVLGVEQRLPPNWEHEHSHCDSDKKWHFKLLGEQNDLLNTDVDVDTVKRLNNG